MRMPLKYQIMLPLSCVMLTTVVLVSIVNAWLAGNRTRQQIEVQLRGIGGTLAGSTFPLTDTVLQQMQGLSGAEFAIGDQQQTIIAASGDHQLESNLFSQPVLDSLETFTLNRRVLMKGQAYFHVAVNLRRPAEAGRRAVLHVFYPVARYQQAWREAVLPPLILGTMALIVVMILSRMTALGVTRPIHRLRDQVDRVARGEFAPVPVPDRDDELRDLSIDVNRMAEMLGEYETDVRRNERLRTLNQLGGGIAHQLRNSITGCRMAVDLHHRHCPLHDDESIAVAVQQLELMEKYLQRFLALGKHKRQPFEPVDLVQIVDHLLPLVRPRAKHLSVAVEWHRPAEPLLISGDADALSQVVVNLVLNALEAASQRGNRPDGQLPARRITLHVGTTPDSQVCLDVFDTGDGLDATIQEKLFEPLISGKPDGVGLGLSIAREIVEQHSGTIQWRRQDEMTCFSIRMPLLRKEIAHGELVSRG